MKPWKPLLALVCLALAAASAAAAVPFKGLSFAPLGACVADLDADGALRVSNIGSSGQDGVSVSCLHMDGASLALDGSCTAADVGARAAMTYHWSLLSQPTASRSTSVSCAVSSSGPAGYIDISATVSDLSHAPTQTVTLSSNGVAVYTASVPAGTVARVSMDATGSCPLPALSCYATRTASVGQVKLALACASFPQTVHVSVAGHDEDCDDVRFSAPVDPADEDCDGVSCDLAVSSPPGSSLHSIRCVDGACRVFDHFVSGTSDAVQLVITDSTGRPSLAVSNIGSSGQDGVEIKLRAMRPGSGGGGGGGAVAGITGGAVAARYAPPSLQFDPATDEGASSVMTIVGRAFSSSGADLGVASGSLALTVQGHNFYCTPSHTGGGATQEWVAVISNGLEVGRAMLPPGSSVQVTPPPGEPLGMAINEKGLPGSSCKPAPNGKTPFMAARPAGIESSPSPPSPSRGVSVDLSRVMRASFASNRIFVFGGLQLTGDELVCFCDDGSGSYAGSFVVSSTTDRLACPNPASSLSSMRLLDLPSVGGDPIGPDVAGSTGLSTAHTCVTVPMLFNRTDTTPVRAFSVRFHLSPELALCGAGVVEGDYLSKVAGTQFFVTDNGGGSYTVDGGILGPVCGATGDGTLFSLNLASALGATGTTSAMGVITMDAVTVRDCSNAPVVADPGSPGYVPIQLAAPPALTDLVATQVKTGNDLSGITQIRIGHTPTSAGELLQVFRKGFGNYPDYDNGSSAGSVPSKPSSSSAALSSGWTPVQCSSSCSSGTCTSTCTSSSLLDSPPSRDYFYYVAFVRDQYGNESPVSNMTTGTLDYHLGDVSDGSSLCVGDNHVSLADISFLGAHYGRVLTGTPFTCLDVGPTLDYSVDTRPTTDGVADFEDFMMIAINWSVVSSPASAHRAPLAAMNASQLVVPDLPPVGSTFDASVTVDGAGNLQGVSVKLAFDPDVLEQVAVTPGALMDQQDRAGMVLSSGPGDVDAALLGTGSGIAGHGEIARVTFRVKSAGDPKLAIASITGRDAANGTVAVAGATSGTPRPAHTALGFAYPNPFSQALAVQLSLRAAGPVSVGVYDVAGRRVRSLVSGTQQAGSRLVTWDGRDDAGVRLAPGAYIVRLETAEVRESRTVRLVR